MLAPPNPFDSKHALAFLAPSQIAKEWGRRRDIAASVSRGEAIDMVGLEWNSLGVSFPANWDFAADAMRKSVRPFYLETGLPSQRRASRIMLARDYCSADAAAEEHQDASSATQLAGLTQGCVSLCASTQAPSQAPLAEASRALVNGLQDRGYALLNRDWSFADLLQHEEDYLLKNAVASLDRSTTMARGTGAQRDAPQKPSANGQWRIPGIEPLIDRLISKLGPVVRAYMGADAELSGYQAFRIHSRSSKFSSSYWHHDRCGKRLKVFHCDVCGTKIVVDSNEMEILNAAP